MDFKNENSRVYSLGDNIICIVLLILSIAYFIYRSDRVLANNYFIMQQISLSLLLILRGTKKVFAKKDKKGYLDYTLGGLILILFIVGLLVKCF